MMLWSLTKVVLFVVVIAALALAAGMLSETGEAMRITVAGWEFIIGPVQAVILGLVIFLAEHAGRPIAGALCLRGGETLYGRYWGGDVQLPGLHFETCYYQGIAYCLHEGLTTFEPGAQGEHKIARGFLPTFVRSRHWISQPDFARALAAWCEEEATAVRRYARTLQGHSPFKQRH